MSWYLTGVVGPGGPIVGSAVSVLVCQVVPNLLYVRRDLNRRDLNRRDLNRRDLEADAEEQARAEAELQAETQTTTLTPFE